MRWRAFFPLHALILLGLFSGGCGYQFGRGSESAGLLHRDSIRIGKINNETGYSSVGIILGEKLKDAMVSNGYGGTFDGEADYLILGSVKSLNERPVGFAEDTFGLEYELTCFVSLDLIEAGSGERRFHIENYAASTTYYSSSDPTYTRTNRENAIRFVMEKVSTRFIHFLKEI